MSKGSERVGVEIDGVVYIDEAHNLAKPANPFLSVTAACEAFQEQIAAVLGIPWPTFAPARPTLREAAVDLWDAGRMFLRVLFLAIAAGFDRLGGAVATRWHVLRARRWARHRGPLIRLWDADFNLVAIVPEGKPEAWRAWLRRQASFVWAVVRNGA